MSGVNVCSHFSPATLLLRAGPVSQGSARAGQEEGWGEARGVSCYELSRFLIGLCHKGRRCCAWAERQLCLMQTLLNASQDAQGATESTWESHLDPRDSGQG